MLRKLRSLVRAALHRSSFERDMDDELRFHLDSRVEALVKTGLPRHDAMRQARLEFGNPEAYQDRCRESRGLRLIDDLIIDLRFALRTMRRDAALSATVIMTLALGIGATSAIVSVVYGVLMRPLPFPEPERLMMVGARSAKESFMPVFGPDFIEWREGCHVCDSMAASAGTWLSNLTGGAEPDRVLIGRVSQDFFRTMGVQPMLGRTFLPEETGRSIFGIGHDTPVTAVILGHGLWQRRFGSDPSVVGKSVSVEGDPCTIVGVMPAGFSFPKNAEAWIPASISPKRDNAYLSVVARLRPGLTAADAQADLAVIVHQINARQTDDERRIDLAVHPLREHIVGDIRSSLLVFLGAVGLVLLIACANVANLLLAQAASRPRELAVRAALGAGRRRIVRQLLTESVLLAVIGGSLGLLIARWLLPLFVALAPTDIPRLESIVLDRSMLGFTLLLSILTGLLFGLAPIARTGRAPLTLSLQDAGGRAAGSVDRQRLRRTLVVAEVSLAVVLLVSAGLLLKSFVLLPQTAIGFNPRGLLTASITLPDATYPTGAEARAYYTQAVERIAALPDVQASGIVNALPLNRYGARISGSFTIDGETEERRGAWARKLAVGGDYFRAAGIPLIKGRLFDQHDTESSPGVVIVSESLARRFWPNQDPIGRRLNVGFGNETWREVVGVVGDVIQDDLGERRLAALYQPYLQVMDARRWLIVDMTFVVRTTGPPERVAAALRGTLAQIDPNLPLYGISTMSDIVAHSTTDPLFYTVLLGGFSLLALALAAAGVYSLIACSVSQRTHEIGIRMALGARRASIMRLVIGEGLVLAAAGGALGLAGAAAVTRLLTRFLHQVSTTDAATFLAVPLVLGGVALVACAVPARRATRVDPIVALRHE
ncbi:MAG TPA: ABC transporter permease [Vicinamibacterales bacterium]|nr:ABC transporter permease [Vicinamibacterales bacterium]